MVAEFANSGGADLTQVGGASLADQLAAVPPLQGIVDQVVAGIYEAFSLAIADTFWFGLVVTLVALVIAAIGLRDMPLLGGATAPADAARRAPPPCAPRRRASRWIQLPPAEHSHRGRAHRA